MGINKRVIDEINRYCRPDSILVIGRDGVLRRLHCPFKVVTLHGTQVSKQDQVVFVDAVRISDELVMLYVINKFAIPFYYFAILPPKKSG